jgi:hypothetical protein
MSEQPKTEAESKPDQSVESEPVKPEPPESPESQKEQVGEFITRHILEKDTVFFEG